MQPTNDGAQEDNNENTQKQKRRVKDLHDLTRSGNYLLFSIPSTRDLATVVFYVRLCAMVPF